MSKREVEWADQMRAAIAGDAAVYDRLLRELAAALRPAARSGFARAGMSVADAEDVVQETLLAVHLKRHTWDQDVPIGPWIRAIARNKLIDSMRRRGRSINVPIDDFIDVLPSDDGEPRASAGDVDRHVDALPERQRLVVRSIAVEGASIVDAAGQLGISQGAVRVALHRGLATLAEKFKDSG